MEKLNVLHLILGGTAVYRCDKGLVSSLGFSGWGKAAAREAFFAAP
jgi:hypothetical protein